MPKDASEPTDTGKVDTGKVKENDTARDAPLPQHTEKGVRAMQGPPDDTAEKTLSRGEMRSVTAQADREVPPPKSKRPTEEQIAAYEHKLQGQIAEESLNLIGAESLNDHKPNAPVYDALLPEKGGFEAASVKTHMPSSRYPDAYLANYAHDLRVAIGATRARSGKYAGMTGPAFAAKVLNSLDELPDTLKDVPPSQLETLLKQNASIRIPADHVEPVRAYVIEQATARPVQYGLQAGAGADEVQQLADRIKPLPVTSDQIKAAVNRRRQALNG
jgi:hypothetical protein